MSNLCVIGLQWGDEAKGKLVDLMTSRYDIVVRYQGGANAGHTVVDGDQTYKLHLVPSGILRDGVTNVVAAGVVIHPETLLNEIRGLEKRGVDVASKLKLSERAHVVFPWHVEEDKLGNTPDPGEESIGTTLRGIGPCYCDKVGRRYGLRLGDLLRSDFADRVRQICQFKNRFLTEFAGRPVELDPAEIARHYGQLAREMSEMIEDTTSYLLDAVESDRSVLFEGAQGALLDVDHGTYPYVTSSNSSGVGVSAGSGLPARWIHNVIGVAKCYSTRVGGGPFPTEQDNETGEHIRRLGNEFGTTTGRPRRCGWFDAVAVRYTARLSGVDGLAMMMLDVLSELEEIQVCTAYRIDGEIVENFPSYVGDLRKVEPVYEVLPGWQTDVTAARSTDDLPENARRYLSRISELVGKPVEVISVGPDRAQTIFCGTAVSVV